MNLFDFTLRIKGFPIKEAMKHLQKVQSFSEVEMAHYIESQKQKIVEFHLNNNDFYKNLVGKVSVSDWNSLPVLQKSDLQQPLKNRLSKGFTEKNVYINKTSGSSGHPFIFAKDKFTHTLVWAVIKSHYKTFHIDTNKSLQARFYGMPIEKKDYYFVRFKDFLSKRYRFSIFDLSDKAIASYLKIFKKKPFEYINGYTTCVLQIAKYLKNNHQTLKEICPTLKVCIVTSEILFDEDKVFIERYLGVPVANEYGASELGIIAFQGIESDFIVNQEDLFIEILDDTNQPLPYGAEGNIVVTSLYNKAHPFIRYKVGDMGVLEKKNNKIILKGLLGRTNDFAVLPSGKKAAGMTFYSVTKSIMESDGNLKEFVIIQTQTNTFRIEYSSKRELTPEEIGFIKSKLTAYLEQGLHFDFIRKPFLERAISGKLKQFTSLVKAE